MKIIIILTLHLAALLVPLSDLETSKEINQTAFQQWPSSFEGQAIHPLPMTDKERGFSQNFPGKIGRFSDGSREIIIRYIDQASRQVHPSADCLRGSGYHIETQPIKRDQNGQLWGCVLAKRNGISYRVCERIYDQSGNSWYDVSSWFWSVLLNKSHGPWWAITVAEEV